MKSIVLLKVKKLLVKLFSCSFFSLLYIQPLSIHAVNYYVSLTGSDNNNGSASAPFRTINQAAQKAQPGDIVLIAGGSYSEMNIAPAASGNQTDGYITFRPLTDADQVIITKTSNSKEDASKHIFNLSGCSYIWIEGIQFADMAYHGACIYMSTSSHCIVTRCRFSHLGQEDINYTTGGTAMVYLNNSSYCVIQNNYFNDIYGDGISYTGSQSKHLLISRNTFIGLKGKKRSWASENYKYSSAINGTAATDATNGYNLICLNYIKGGQDGIWLDRGCSNNILARNWGDGAQRLVFLESRCDDNWVQENIALNMTESGFRSALYDDTDWTSNTRWLHNIAYSCAKGFYINKSKHNEIRGNIAYENTNYSLQFTESAVSEGSNEFSNNLWYSSSINKSMLYNGTAMSTADFATAAPETDGIYDNAPLFASTSTDAYDFSLQDNSPCKGTASGGIDIGAYAVYAPTTIGCDDTYTHKETQIGFDELITEAKRGESYILTLRRTSPATEKVTYSISPIAGELQQHVDFTLNTPSVTFEEGETTKQISISFIGHDDAYDKLLILQVTSNLEYYDTRSFTAFKLQSQAGEEYEKSQDKMVITTTLTSASTQQAPFLWLTQNASSNQLKNIQNKLGNSVSGGLIFGYASNNSLNNGYMDWNGYDRIVVRYSNVSSGAKIRFLGKDYQGKDAHTEQALTAGTPTSTTYLSNIAQGYCTSIKCNGTVTATQVELIKEFRVLSNQIFNIAPSINSTVSYNRAFTVGQAVTVCLPFSLTASEASIAGKFYTLSQVVGDNLIFSSVNSPIAYTPYLFVPAVESPFTNLPDKTIESSVGKSCQTAIGDYTFQGTLAATNDITSKDSDKTFYGWDAANGSFGKVGSESYIPAFRAYIVCSASSSARTLSATIDGTTGIQFSSTQETQKENKASYNLAGQKVDASYKGVVIEKGKKILVR